MSTNPIDNDGSVFITNLVWSIDDDELADIFSRAGRVIFSRTFLDKDGRPAGRGVVGFSSKEEARRCIEMMDGAEIQGRKVAIKYNIQKIRKKKELIKEKEMKDRERREMERMWEMERNERDYIFRGRDDRDFYYRRRDDRNRDDRNWELRDRNERDRNERDRNERDRSERDRSERDRSERDRNERDRSERDRSERDRNERDRNERDRSERDGNDNNRNDNNKNERDHNNRKLELKEMNERDRNEKDSDNRDIDWGRERSQIHSYKKRSMNDNLYDERLLHRQIISSRFSPFRDDFFTDPEIPPLIWFKVIKARMLELYNKLFKITGDHNIITESVLSRFPGNEVRQLLPIFDSLKIPQK